MQLIFNSKNQCSTFKFNKQYNIPGKYEYQNNKGILPTEKNTNYYYRYLFTKKYNITNCKNNS